MTDLEPSFGKGIGMHILFRTTDNATSPIMTRLPRLTMAPKAAFTSLALTLIESGIGYHICPPFNKHLDRAWQSACSTRNFDWTYNENIVPESTI